METLTTKDIKISVETFYQEKQSNPAESKYIFAYRITIQNLGETTVQLLRRYWRIVDSNGDIREVEGEGIVGQQPILASGESHQYVSWCPLLTDVGQMNGHYQMLDRTYQQNFEVQIPAFRLIAPFKQN